MGEYATYKGQQIKMGTCEDMYYLRATQARQVEPEQGSLDPTRPDVQQVIRFRFPWPDEDGIEPGAFTPYDRSVGVWDVSPPAELEHHLLQFTATAGYNVCLPCPESPAAGTITWEGAAKVQIHRNGFAGPVGIVQQGFRNGVLALICRCGGCGAKYNLPTLADAEPVIVACRAEADNAQQRAKVASRGTTDGSEDSTVTFWHAIADRIAAGYGH